MTKNQLIKQSNYEKIRNYIENTYINKYSYKTFFQIDIYDLLILCEKLGESKTINFNELTNYLKQFFSIVETISFLENDGCNTYLLIRE